MSFKSGKNDSRFGLQMNKLWPFYVCWFCWYAILDRSSLSLDQSNQPACNSFVFIPNLSFFVLGFNVDHSKLIRLSFCHVLSWFANITNSKRNKNDANVEITVLIEEVLSCGSLKSHQWSMHNFSPHLQLSTEKQI